jgi:hypothetical protein
MCDGPSIVTASDLIKKTKLKGSGKSLCSLYRPDSLRSHRLKYRERVLDQIKLKREKMCAVTSGLFISEGTVQTRPITFSIRDIVHCNPVITV